MGIVVLAVSIIIGVYLVGSIYNATPTTGMPASVTQAISTTLTNSTTGMELLAVAIIVGAAVFILSIMGGH
jgi:hypothetical protein